jgi:hypothetical protein
VVPRPKIVARETVWTVSGKDSVGRRTGLTLRKKEPRRTAANWRREIGDARLATRDWRQLPQLTGPSSFDAMVINEIEPIVNKIFNLNFAIPMVAKSEVSS